MNALPSLLTGQLDIWTSAETEKKSGRGRSSGNGTSVYGIKKLRELILELAVRGKLVLQDLNDEPAGELLKRIQIEKTKLIAEGKIKKDKPLPPISDEEKPFELPQGWEWARWDQVALKIGDIDHKMPETVKNGIPYVSPRDFIGNYIDFDNAKTISNEDFIKLSAKIKPQLGDLIFPRYGTIGENVLVIIEREFLASYSCAVIKTMNNFINPKYQYIYSISETTKKQAKAAENKTTQANVGIKSIQEFLMPIPPLAEQHRIVAKVDELMALCDQLENQHINAAEAHEKLVNHLLGILTQSQNADDFNANWQRIAAHFDTLFTTETSIDALKQTLLQLAVMGKLVPQNPNDEPASELLKRIQAEKAKLVAEGKIKKDKPLPPISDEKKPFELPRRWEWARLFEVITEMDSGWSPACLENNSPSDSIWGVLKTTAVQVMQYCEEENKELPGNLVPRPEAEVKGGDILFTRAGPTNRVAISCYVQKTRSKLMISDKIIRFHPIDIGINGHFVTLCLNTGVTAIYLENAKSGMAASQVNISQEKLRLAPIPLPPLLEQHRIVTKVDELMALCDQLKFRITQASQLQKKLADVVVEQAIAS